MRFCRFSFSVVQLFEKCFFVGEERVNESESEVKRLK